MDVEIHRNDRRNKKLYPYVVYFTTYGTKRRRFFQTNSQAAEWADKMKDALEGNLPIGVTFDARLSKNQYLARIRVKGILHRRYCSTVEDATNWLNSFLNT